MDKFLAIATIVLKFLHLYKGIEAPTNCTHTHDIKVEDTPSKTNAL